MYINEYYVLDLYKELWCATIADNVMEMYFLKYTMFYFIQRKCWPSFPALESEFLITWTYKLLILFQPKVVIINLHDLHLIVGSFLWKQLELDFVVWSPYNCILKWFDLINKDRVLYLYTRFSPSSFALHSLPHYHQKIRIDTNLWHQFTLYMYI